jgi:hypothetical protein
MATWRIRIRFAAAAAALAFAGCPGARQGSAISKPGERPNLVPLVGSALPEKYRSAAEAIAAALRQDGEEPREFSCEVEPSADRRELIFHLWHESAFRPENRGVVGNPGGRCRDVSYDPRQQRITRTLFWQ